MTITARKRLNSLYRDVRRSDTTDMTTDTHTSRPFTAGTTLNTIITIPVTLNEDLSMWSEDTVVYFRVLDCRKGDRN